MSDSRTIVVGIDGSDTSLSAIDAALAECDPGDRLVVAHVYWIPPEVRYYEFFEDVENKFAEVGMEMLDPARQKLADVGDLEVEYVAEPGKAADVLAEIAKRNGAALIVIGACGTGRVRAMLGSTAHRLLHEMPCPVLVVPPAG